jgi:CBS domain-containing protein
MKRSILTEKVARRGYDIFREYAVDPLESMRIEECMTSNVESVPAALTVADAAQRFFSGVKRHRGYPVVGADGLLVGVITASDLLSNPSPTATVGELLSGRNLLIAHPSESCRIAADRMALHGVGRLPVISDAKTLVGIITRSDLLKARLRRVEEETTRSRAIRIGDNISQVWKASTGKNTRSKSS